MSFCSKCGAQLGNNAAFCPSCGQPQGAAPAGGESRQPGGVSSQSGLAENVAGTLCYSVGWITGIIFFVIDQRPSVRFHAAQSIVTFGGIHLIRICVGFVLGVGMMTTGVMDWARFSAAAAIFSLIGLVAFVLCMVKAYQGEKFKLPIAGDFAEQLLAK
jgi:uncharacterized membrane protein